MSLKSWYQCQYKSKLLKSSQRKCVRCIKVNAQQSRVTQPRLDVWQSLMANGASKVLSAGEAAVGGMANNITKVGRWVGPLPRGFPPGPPGDQAVALLSGPLEFLNNTHRRYGGLVGLLIGGELAVLVTSSQAANEVLVKRSHVFVKEGTAFFPGSSLTGNGLLVSDGDTWLRQRRLANHAFRKAAVDAYAGAMVEATVDMLERVWGSNPSVRDAYADFNALTLRITLDALFGEGKGLSEQDAEAIVACVERAFEFFTRRVGSGMIIPEWLPTWENLEFGSAVAQLDQVVYGIISRRKAELAKREMSMGPTPAGKSDLLTSMMTARDEDGSGMTDVALRDEVMTLLVAGQETSAIMLSWTCALLAQDNKVQIRARQEVDCVLNGTTPSYANVRSLPYLEAVLLESLRLYSPAYMVGRCVPEDTELCGFQLPKGTTILVSPYVMHRDAKVWPDAHVFDPGRWAAIQSAPGYGGAMSLMSNLGPNGSYLPFGAGPRYCIGTGFALMEGLVVLAAILQRYRLKLEPTKRRFPVPKPLLTLRPDNVDLVLIPRA